MNIQHAVRCLKEGFISTRHSNLWHLRSNMLTSMFVTMMKLYKNCYHLLSKILKINQQTAIKQVTLNTRQISCCINLFDNLKANLCKCYHETMNSPHLTFFTKLTQHWRKTLRKRFEFDIVVPKLYQGCRYRIYDILPGAFSIQSWHDVETTL